MTILIKSTIETDEETGEPLYWHNGDGWVEIESATSFTEEDTEWMNLPAGGIWVECHSNGEITAFDL